VSAAARRSLREACEEDHLFLKKVFFSARQRVFAAANLSPSEQEKVLEQQFTAQNVGYRAQSPNADYHVILIDGERAGRIYVDRREDEIGLMEMTLLPRFRNQGIGTGLIEELLTEAGDRGKPVVLYVEHWNPDARRLYQRLGFEEEEDLTTHWKMRWTPP